MSKNSSKKQVQVFKDWFYNQYMFGKGISKEKNKLKYLNNRGI